MVPNDGMPDAVPGEFAFAASGTCLVAAGGRDAWFGTGGSASRVFHSTDRGRTWTVTDAPIPPSDSEAGGVFSLAFRNTHDGVMVGGDLSGYRSGVDWVSGSNSMLIAVGPTGSDVSFDGARSWRQFDTAHYDAVDCVPRTSWASGPAGAVARFDR